MNNIYTNLAFDDNAEEISYNLQSEKLLKYDTELDAAHGLYSLKNKSPIQHEAEVSRIVINLTENYNKNLSTPSMYSSEATERLSKYKQINRELTRNNLLPKENEIIKERAQILKVKYSVGLTKEYENKLKYLDWQLDRIDDVKHGEHLETLEKLIEQHEKTAMQIEYVIKKYL